MNCPRGSGSMFASMPHDRRSRLPPSSQRNHRNHQEHGDAEPAKHVDVGEGRGLDRHLPIDHDERSASRLRGGSAGALEGRGQRLEACDEGHAESIGVADQIGLMHLRAARDERGSERDPDIASHIPRQINDTRRSVILLELGSLSKVKARHRLGRAAAYQGEARCDASWLATQARPSLKLANV